MAMGLTTLNELVNPQVMGNMVSEEIGKRMKFMPLCRVDDTLKGRAGDTVTVPKFAYIGDAEDVGEGDSIPLEQMASETEDVTVKKAGKGVEISDEAALSGYGDPIGEINRQLGFAIANKIDNDVLEALGGIGTAMTCDASTKVLSADVIADALTRFGENDYLKKVIFIAPAQLAQLRKSEGWLKVTDVGAEVLLSGAVGCIHGCQVMVSDKIVEDDGEFTNFIVQPGALALYLKRELQVETERDIIKKTTIVTADKHYALHLADESKAVLLISKA